MEDNEIIIDLNDNSNDITIEQNPAAGTATNNYNDLNNKPKINNVELAGNKTAAQLGFATVATTGSYDDLDDKPTIPTAPTKTSDLTNDSGYITKSVDDLTNYTKTTDLSSVATSGSYNDLNNKPSIPAIATSTTTGTTNAYCVDYINTMLGNIETVLTTLTTGGGVS